MVRNKLIVNRHLGLKLTMTMAALASLFSILACSINLPGSIPPKNSTDVARSVEATINAETVATLQAQETQVASGIILTQSEDPGISATIQFQQATLVAKASPQAPQETQTVAVETTPTAESAGALESIQITDWKMAFWISLPNGCKEGAPCWKTDDDFDKHMGYPLLLTSKQSILINPNWLKPSLVFWNKRDNSYPSTVELIIDGKHTILKQYSKGRSDWQKETIDLSSFKGKEIYVLFSILGKQGSFWSDTAGPGSNWFVESVQIFPEYSY